MPPSQPLAPFARGATRLLPRRPVAAGALLARTRRCLAVPRVRLGSASQGISLPAVHARRAYSTEKNAPPSTAPSKIWGFEEMQDLTSSPADRNVTIIDVREPSELQQTGRIPGAINIPVTSNPDSFHVSAEEFEDRFGFPRPAADGEAVFYCKAGVRSRAAAGLARDAGWTRVGEYPGSWLDWEKRGGKVER